MQHGNPDCTSGWDIDRSEEVDIGDHIEHYENAWCRDCGLHTRRYLYTWPKPKEDD